MAEAVPDVDEQSLQQFLSDSPWDSQGVMDQVANDVNSLLGGRDSALLLDETGIVKKGKHSVGVGHQWCGRLGKVENCRVGVFAALAKGSDACLIDAELYVPESWKENPARCDKARIPTDKRTSRRKLAIALTLVKRAKANGVKYGWVGADSFYGRDRSFQQALNTLGETFMVDVPKDFRIYNDDPRPYLPSPAKTGRKSPRHKSDATSIKVSQLITEDDQYRRYQFRLGTQGAMAVDVIHRRVWVWDGQSAQAHWWHLLIRRDQGGEVKYSISNAPAKTSVHRLLYIQGQRHFIERSFQNSKSHLGLHQYQARNWNAWHHHMALIMMAMVFLLEQRSVRKDSYPLLTVSDMVLVFATILPSRINDLDQAIAVVEERHRKRRKDLERRSRGCGDLQRWAQSG